MKRRRFFTTLAAAPAVPALLGQQGTQTNNSPRPGSPVAPPLDATQPPAPMNRTPSAAVELPKLEFSVADDAAEMAPHFFSASQFAALKKLSEVVMPSLGGAAGALEADAPAFLDFLIGESPKDRQQLYKSGLDTLNLEAGKRFGKTFSDANPEQVAALLAPLRQPWTFVEPADVLTRFLRSAKQDVRAATMNSREYITSAASGGGRRGAGVGLYWYPLD